MFHRLPIWSRLGIVKHETTSQLFLLPICSLRSFDLQGHIHRNTNGINDLPLLPSLDCFACPQHSISPHRDSGGLHDMTSSPSRIFLRYLPWSLHRTIRIRPMSSPIRSCTADDKNTFSGCALASSSILDCIGRGCRSTSGCLWSRIEVALQ